MKELVWDKYIGNNYDNDLCHCCNETLIKKISFTCGYMKSEKNGGKPTLENLRPICESCELSIGTRNMNELKKTNNKLSNINKNNSIDINYNNVYDEYNYEHALLLYLNGYSTEYSAEYSPSNKINFKKNILVNAYLNKYENKFSRK